MPKNAIDYSKTIIYRIVCKDVNVTECYVGQTTNFTKRKQCHKHSCNTNNTCYVYQFIRNNLGFENWDMVEVEKYNAVDSNDASKRERYWIEFYKASLNKNIPSRTHKEYREENKEILAERSKEYYENNKEIVAEKSKKYRNKNKEILAEKDKQKYEKNKEIIAEKHKEYFEKNKQQIAEQRKEYYEENKQQLLEYHKEYYKENKQQLAEQRKEKVTCECGCIIKKYYLSQHKKTKIHLDYTTRLK
jgi:hypothetical protein